MISAARFTGYFFSYHDRTQHSSAGLFSNVRFADFVSALSKSLAVLCLIGLLPVSVRSNIQSQEIDVLKTETNLTNLLFTVTDKNHRYITNLQQADVRVLEDGVPQTLFTFQRETDRPLAIAFLIDVSGSEAETLPNEKAAAREFIESVISSSRDQVAIVPFEGYAHLEQPLSHDMIAIYRALEQVEVANPMYLGSAPPMGGIVSQPGTIAPPQEGWTSIWDSVAVTSRQVLARASGQRRRAIILLTDGYDSSSRISQNAAIDQAIASETVIYAIGIGDRRRLGIDRDALDKIAERTGGRAFFPKKEADLKSAFGEIEQELRSQYLIAYSSTNKRLDGSFRKMTIEITNPGLQKEKLKLRYRPGYFAKKASN